MTNRFVKVAVTITVLCLAFAGLLWATLQDGAQYYKYVDEVVADRAAWEGRRLQVHGYVVPGSIMRRENSLDYKFKIQRNGSVIDATYSGVVPDPFRGGREIVLTGELERGTFVGEPDTLVTKCPSKFTTADAS